MMMFEPKRIHPIGMIINLLKILKSYVVPAIFIFIVGNNIDFNIYFIIGAIILIVGLIVTSFLDWLKFTYRIESGEVRIEHGVFVKKKRYIPIERIQSINISAGIIQQIFGLVKVQIETASGGLEAEAVLIAIKKLDADEMNQVISAYKKAKPDSMENEIEEVEEETRQLPTYKMTKKDLFVAASTSSGIGMILSACAAFISQFEEFIPYDTIFARFEFLTNASLSLYIVLIFSAFVFTWIISVIGVLLKYAFFTVIKDEKELRISKGIFEKQQISIPLSRIQAVRIVQNPLRQLLRYSTIYIESAGGSVADNGSSTVLFPVVSNKKVHSLLEEYLPTFEHHNHLKGLPKRSLLRYLLREVAPSIIIIILISYFYMPYGLFSLFLLPISIYWGYRVYKDSGWKVSQNQLELGYRILSKTVVLIQRNKLQSMMGKTSYFQNKHELQTLSVSIKSGVMDRKFTVKDMERYDVEDIVDWYSYKAKEGLSHKE